MPHGSCACGEFAYEFDDKPTQLVVCHCLPCRKLSGGPATYNLAVPDDYSFKITSGSSKEWTRTADSGKSVKYHSCPTCASILYVEIESLPGVKVVKMGSIDDADYITSVGPPVGEIYSKNMIDWEKPWEGADTKHTQ